MFLENLLVHCLFNYRWIFVCVFLLPCTVVYDILIFLKSAFGRLTKQELNEVHLDKVKFVQQQVNNWNKSDKSVPMCTGRPGWKTMTLREPKYKATMYNIHIDMDSIIDIDFDKRVIKVEPLVTMGQISSKLNPKKWTLPIVAELDDLTVGGLIMGTGIESSSHTVGLFQHICISYELVLADGSLVTCSKDNDPDLFYAIPWSYGTLGFLTAVELKIVPCKRFVKLEYEPFFSLDEGVSLFIARSMDKNNNQFVEGILFSKDEGVVMTGNMTDEAVNVNSIGRWYKPWFYEHVRSLIVKGKSQECIPLRDYYHRHNKSIFWELKDIVPFGNHPVFRWLLGWTMPPKISFLKKTQTKTIKDLYEKHHVVQDLIIPIKHMKEAISFFEKEVNVYPIWLCPALLPNEPGFVHSFSNESEFYIDIGLYGTPLSKKYDYVETTKRIEQFTIKNQGYQMMYPGTYCSESDYRIMFDHSLYDQLRVRLQCSKAFPSVYGKVNRKARD